MRKRNLLKLSALTAVVISMFLFAACGSDPQKKSTEQTSSQTDVETSISETSSLPSSTAAESKAATEAESTAAESSAETEAVTTSACEAPSDEIAEISGASDENGIYSIMIKMSDQAADKAAVEMVYYGQKGSPQENSIVNTFRIEYEKDTSGHFKIRTFFDGEAYQNQDDKDKVKVVNTFGAALRAGKVIISYTPDGGDTQEIYSAEAEQFFVPTK